MRFNEKRAKAFAEYTVTALLEELADKKNGEKKTFLSFSKPDFSKILGTQKLRPEHIDTVRAKALEQGVCMANMGHTLIFFYYEKIEKACGAVTLKEAKEITDAFEKVYGSDAADEMWEEGTYRD